MLHRVFCLLLVCSGLAANECGVTLDQAVASALCYNYSLEAEKFASKEADARVVTAWSQFWPRVVWSGEYLRSPAVSLTGSSIDTHRTAVEGRQLLFDPQAFSEFRLRKRELLALQYEVEAFVDQLVYEVSDAFYRAVIASANVEVQQENVRLLQEQADHEEGRHKAGSSTLFDVDQAKVALANATSELHGARREYKVSQSALANLMGLEAREARCLTPLHPDLSIAAYPLLSGKLERLDTADSELWNEQERSWWLDRMYEGRSDLKAREALVAAAGAEVSRQRGDYYPRVDAFARHVNVSDNSFEASFFSTKTSYWETGVSFSWTLFDGFGRKGRICEAQMARERRMSDYLQAVQDAEIGLLDHFDSIEEAIHAYRASRLGAKIAQEGVTQAIGRRDQGAITPLEYRESVHLLTGARLRELRSIYETITAYLALRRDVGLDRLEGRF